MYEDKFLNHIHINIYFGVHNENAWLILPPLHEMSKIVSDSVSFN